MNYLDKQTVIAEGLGEYRDESEEYESPFLFAQQMHPDGLDVNWQNVVTISHSLCNSLPLQEERARDYGITNPDQIASPDRVYIATHSMGGRDWVGEPTRHIGHGISTYAEFSPDDAESFEWQSATSGATIRATKNSDGTWRIQFAEGEHESNVYAGIYANLARWVVSQEVSLEV
ncbi:MAG: hypothetical protein WCP03_00125 [Candidatus Saccharibacteria bacterium]